MPMEQWPGPNRDEDNGGCWDGFEEADEDEPGQWLPGADYEPDEEFPGEMLAGPEYWLLKRLRDTLDGKDEEDT